MNLEQFMRIGNLIFTQSAAGGALPMLLAATHPEAEGGAYYGPSGFGGSRGSPKLVESNNLSHDEDIAKKL